MGYKARVILPTTPVEAMDVFLRTRGRAAPKVAVSHAATRILREMIIIGKWGPDDWSDLMARYYGQIRPLFGDGHLVGPSSEEWWYRFMVESDNAGACRSFERWAKRPAYRTADKSRLFVGSETEWDGIPVTVTSFRDGYLVACGTDPATGKGRQFKLSPEDVRTIGVVDEGAGDAP